MGKMPAAQAPFMAANVVGHVSFAVGPLTSHVINVAVQLQDANWQNLTQRGAVRAYLSDNADGSTLTATAPGTSVGIGTNGLELELVTKKVFELVSNASGQVDLNLSDNTGAKTWYLVVILPDGSLNISPAMIFS